METAPAEVVAIGKAPADFERHEALLTLVQGAFAAHAGRIDPPSSASRASAASLRAMAADGVLVLAACDMRLVGCVFGVPQGEALHLSKLAVDPAWQGRGIGRRLVEALTDHARTGGFTGVTLGVRLVLTENIRLFERMGFVATGVTRHPGFSAPTSQDMRLTLDP